MKKNQNYIEGYDKVFDRMLFVKNNNLSYIIARIKRNYKNKTFKNLVADSKLKIIKNKKNIIEKKFTYYVNNSRNLFQIKNLKKLNQIKQIQVINTSQFVKSFLKLKLI